MKSRTTNREKSVGRRLGTHAACAVALALLAPLEEASAGYLWISPSELASIPMEGPAWDALYEIAQESIVPDIGDQSADTESQVLAAALVYARNGNSSMRTKARDAILAAIGTEDSATSALGPARNLMSIVIAAQLVDLGPGDRAVFEDWLRNDVMRQSFGSRTIVETHEHRPNNWGTHAGATRLAVALYLDDTAEVARCIQVFRGWLGDRDSYADFSYGDLSWQANPNEPVGINPKGSTIDGYDVDGVVPDDQRRGGAFSWPPPQVNYVYGALQGVIAQAVLLDRAGHPDVWQWEDQAILRAYRWLYEVAHSPASEDDVFQLPLVDLYYGTSYWDGSVTEPGKAIGFTDYTHARTPSEPDIAVSPGSYAFGDVAVGSVETYVLQVRNLGTSPLTVRQVELNGLDTADFSVQSGTTPFVLTRGETHTLLLSFHPKTSGSKRATIRILSDDPDEDPLDVPISGNVGALVPDIDVSPAAHEYGDVPVGETASQAFRVRNEGTADLNVSGILIVGANAEECEIASGNAPFSVSPGASHDVVVSFTPASEGLKSATVLLVSNDPDEILFDLSLTATGVTLSSDIDVSPLFHDFGDVSVGNTARTTFVVHNEGNLGLGVLGTLLLDQDASEFTIERGAAPFTLGPGQAREIDLAFRPESSGPKSATLLVVSEDPDEGLIEIPLAGNSVSLSPDIHVSPPSHDFGQVTVGAAQSAAFTLSNAGSGPLQVSGAFLVGAASSEFSIESGSPPFTLDPGETRDLVVRFAPSSGGIKSARVDVTSDDPDESVISVTLAGIAGELTPRMAVNPPSFDFGTVSPGNALSNGFRVSNEGTASLLVSGVVLVGENPLAFTIDEGFDPFTVLPGAFRDVVVSFRPVVAEEQHAAVRIVSNDPAGIIFDVPVSGNTGTAPDIALDANAIDFGDVSVGEVSSRAVTVENRGNASLQVFNSLVTGPQATDFGVVSGAAPFSLAPGATRIVQVSFAPTAAGARGASLQLTTNDPDEGEVAVSLAGEGVEAPAPITLEETRTGGSTASPIVISQALAGGPGEDLYLAAISSKRATDVDGVTGLGLDWTRVGNQCAGRNQTGVEVWMAVGSSAGGEVTATLSTAPSNAAIAVSRYSGVDVSTPLGSSTSGNTNGVEGACQDGVDSDRYSFDLVTNTPGARVYGTSSSRSGAHEPGAGFTEHVDFHQGTGGGTVGLVVQDGEATAGATSIRGTFSSNVDWAVIALEIRPGAGVQPAPAIEVSPVAYDFGPTLVDLASTAPFRIRNTGDASLSVDGLEILGGARTDFAIVDARGSFALAPGTSRVVEVRFRPTSSGPRSAVLRISSDDPARSEVDVMLTGTGLDSPPTASDVAFVDVTSGEAIESEVVVSDAVTAAPDQLFLATITTKSFRRATAVTGLGLTWTRVASQCGGRDQTGVDVWMAVGSPSESGPVRADLEGRAKSAVLAVARYSGADPSNPVYAIVGANSNGPGGSCSGGLDGASYSFEITTTLDGSVVFSSAAMRNKSHEPGDGFDERFELVAGSGGSAASATIMDRTIDVSATVEVAGSFSATVDWAVVAFAIRPAGISSSAAPRLAESGGPAGRERIGEEVAELGLSGYPNPFRNETTLEYSIPGASHTSVTIYDVTGREVRRLADGFEAAGSKSIRWDGRDSSGRLVSPGVYFVRMKTVDHALTKKLVLRR